MIIDTTQPKLKWWENFTGERTEDVLAEMLGTEYGRKALAAAMVEPKRGPLEYNHINWDDVDVASQVTCLNCGKVHNILKFATASSFTGDCDVCEKYVCTIVYHVL